MFGIVESILKSSLGILWKILAIGITFGIVKGCARYIKDICKLIPGYIGLGVNKLQEYLWKKTKESAK